VEATARLKFLFYLASRWSAILHVENADFLFEKRERDNPGTLGMNPLRSAFLREVVYFDSVMIMTTSRIGWADEEVLQIIHLPIYFQKLDEMMRRKVWQMMLRQCVDEDDIVVQDDTREMVDEESSKLPLNAKQIRNCLVVAVALAKSENSKSNRAIVPLKGRHVKAALKTTQEFMKYMTAAQGSSFEDVAVRRGVRDDSLDAYTEGQEESVNTKS
jgi:hypothetical protein